MIIRHFFLRLIFLYPIIMHGDDQVLPLQFDSSVHYGIRKATRYDEKQLKFLYQKVALNTGGLARTYDEITDVYIEKILCNGIDNGLALVVEYDGKLIGSMIKYKLEPKVFLHVLAEGSIIIDPDFQGRGIGSKLILTFLNEIKEYYPGILRVEIIARESNPAIKLYKKLGFNREGKFEGRIRGIHGKLEADIPMVWINPSFIDTVYSG